MEWIAAGVAIAAVAALVVVVRVVVLILTELRIDAGGTEDDPVDWDAETMDEARIRRRAPRVRRAV